VRRQWQLRAHESDAADPIAAGASPKSFRYWQRTPCRGTCYGRAGNFDHYGTAQCMSRTGMSQADARNLTLFQQSFGMCPDVYNQFRHR
jgi:hypothetical protein